MLGVSERVSQTASDEGEHVSVAVYIDGNLNLLPTAKKEFKTGSRGYYANGKVMINGKSYQVGCNIVEIGSKPKNEKNKKKEK